MTIDVDELDDGVLNAIIYDLGLKPDEWDDFTKVNFLLERVREMNVEEAFNRFLRYNGLVDYGDFILNAIDNIRASVYKPEISLDDTIKKLEEIIAENRWEEDIRRTSGR